MRLFKHNHQDTPAISKILPDAEGDIAKKIRQAVKIGCIVNAFLMLIKLSAGYFGNSDALVADGFHSLNDMAADLMMLVFVGISYKKVDKNYTYGYGKFQTFSSMLISAFLIFIAGVIVFEAVESIVEFFNGALLPKPDIWTVVVVLLAMACKEGLFRFYHHTGLKTNSRALIANAWHHRSDAMASIATLVGVTFSHFFGPSFRIMDPLASIVIAVFIFIPALRLLLPSFKELMEHGLNEGDIQKAEAIILAESGVNGLDYIRSRRVGHRIIFDIGVKSDPKMTIEESSAISKDIEKKLSKAFCRHILVTVCYSPD